MCRNVIVTLAIICAVVVIGYCKLIESQIVGTDCGVDEYRCRDGQCIESTLACNGVAECEDGSDESTLTCSYQTGPWSEFRLHRNASNRVIRASKLWQFLACIVPPQPKLGTRRLHPDFCENEDCDVSEGSTLYPGSQLIYSCDPGCKLKGNPEVYCGGRGKWSAIPVCVEIKCEPLNTATTSAICFHAGEPVNCNFPVSPETKAKVSCQAGYRKDSTSGISRRDKIECKTDGEWRPKPINCVPECGVGINHQTPFVLNGTRASVADFPWHATLYQEITYRNKQIKDFICGATVIHAKMVLTAAHCIYDERTRSTKNPNNLHVATGNIFRDYDSPLHAPDIVQKSVVRNVYRYCQYYGRQGNYVADIAMLQLQDPFAFSSILLPACLDVSGFSTQILEPGASGKVAGFGLTQAGTSSAVLRTVTVPYVSYSTCRSSRNGAQDEVFISDDKFCAGYADGSAAVCEGDSGGGLVFQKNGLWYVMGVVSVALGDETRIGEKKCESYSYTLYTKVGTYIEWIQDILYEIEYNEYSSPCDLKCTPINSASTTTRCYLSGRWTICDFPVPPRTRAKISCNEGYVRASSGHDTIECKTNGKWEPELVECVPRSSPVGEFCTTFYGRLGVCKTAERCPTNVLEMISALQFSKKNCDSDKPQTDNCCPLEETSTTVDTPAAFDRPGFDGSVHGSGGGGGGGGGVVPASSPAPALKPIPGDVPQLPPSQYEPLPLADREPIYPENEDKTVPFNSEFSPLSPGIPKDPTIGDGRGEIAREKCAEYAEYLFLNSSAIDEKKQCSDSRDDSGVLVTGTAKPQEFPYMSMIGFNDSKGGLSWLCGGTLISERYVVSVARCSQIDGWGKPVLVRVGEIDTSRQDEGAQPQDRPVIDIICHPSWKPKIYYHDIALYKLETPVILNPWVFPACLHTMPFIDPSASGIVTGWGRLDWTDEETLTELRRTNLSVVDHVTCQHKYFPERNTTIRGLPKGIVEDHILCVNESRVDACQVSQAGSPMTVPSSGVPCMYELISIRSFDLTIGSFCGTSRPGGYTRIYNYIRWLESVVWP